MPRKSRRRTGAHLFAAALTLLNAVLRQPELSIDSLCLSCLFGADCAVLLECTFAPTLDNQVDRRLAYLKDTDLLLNVFLMYGCRTKAALSFEGCTVQKISNRELCLSFLSAKLTHALVCAHVARNAHSNCMTRRRLACEAIACLESLALRLHGRSCRHTVAECRVGYGANGHAQENTQDCNLECAISRHAQVQRAVRWWSRN